MLVKTCETFSQSKTTAMPYHLSLYLVMRYYTNPGAAAMKMLQCQSCKPHPYQITDGAILIADSFTK